MIKLYCFGPTWGVDDPSPFCLKVITYLRLSGISYQSEEGVRYMRAAPKRKLPYIDDDGEIVSDSVHIIEYLKERYGTELQAEQSTEKRGALRGLCRMLDEDLYWQIVYFRWADADNWERFTRPKWFGKMAWPKKAIWPHVVRGYVKNELKQQGTGRHDAEEVARIGTDNLQAVADYLGDKPFIGGISPCDADATIYGFLENIATPPHESPLKVFVESQKKLLQYLGRMRKLTIEQSARESMDRDEYPKKEASG